MTWESLIKKIDKWNGMLTKWQQTSLSQSAHDERLFGKMIFLWLEPVEKLQELLCLSPLNGETDLQWEPADIDGLDDAQYKYSDISDGQAFRELSRSIDDDAPGAKALTYILYSDETLVDNGGRAKQHTCLFCRIL